MKLLLCFDCSDVRALYVHEPVSCRCGKCSGRYLSEQGDAEFSGDGVLIGFNNRSLVQALRAQREKGNRKDGWGWSIEAFVIPEAAYRRSSKS